MLDNYIFKLSDMKACNISLPYIKGRYLKDYRNASYRSNSQDSPDYLSIECILGSDYFFEKSFIDNSIYFFETEKFDYKVAPKLGEGINWNGRFVCVEKNLEDNGVFSVVFHRESPGIDGERIYAKMYLTGVGECKFQTGTEYTVVY